MNNQPPFNIILGTMRSGSTLCVHILNELGIIKCAGETRTFLKDEESIEKCIKSIDLQIPTKSRAPHTDKILHRKEIGDINFVSHRCETIYVLTRHPLIVWNSIKEVSWGTMGIEFLEKQYKFILTVIDKVPEKIIYFSYYDFTSPQRQEKMFGTAISSYSLLSTTGVPHWGDTEQLIKTGKVATRTEWQDIRRALKKHAHILLWKKYWKVWFLYTKIRIRLFFLSRSSQRNLKEVLRRYRK